MARDITFGIRLKADGSGFVGEVKLAGGEVEKFGRQVRGTSDSVQRSAKDMEASLQRAVSVGATIGTVLGSAIVGVAKQIAGAIPKAVEELDNLAKTAEGLGLSAVAFSEFATGARLAGVGGGQFEGSLTRLNQRLTDAANGGRESAALFKAMGIQVTDANGKVRDTGEVLREVADRFRLWRDGAEKSALAAELFGRQAGPRMVAYLNQGGDAMRVSNGVTEDLVRQAKEAQQQIEALGIEFEKLKNAILSEALPPIVQFARELTTAKQATGSWIQALDLATSSRNLSDVAADIEKSRRRLAEGVYYAKSEEARLRSLQAEYAILEQRAGAASRAAQESFVRNRNALSALEPGRGQMGLPQAPRDERSRGGGRTTAQRDDYERLNRTIRERIALMEAEEEQGRSLTSAEQFRVKVLDDLAAGELKLVSGSGEALRAELDRLVAVERGTIARREAEAAIRRANEASARELQAVEAETSRVVEAIRVRGLLKSSVVELDIARHKALLTQQLAEDADEREIEHTRNLIAAKERLRDAVRAQEHFDAADEVTRQAAAAQKAVSELDQFSLQAARNIQSHLGDELFGLLQGRFDGIGDRFKAMLDRMVAEAAAAQLGKYLFGDFGASGQVGGLFGNLIGSFFGAGPLPSAGTVAGMTPGVIHAGGVVGEPMPRRRVSAAAFAGAQRLHAGGMPGLRPNEVPAILERGEEVLTRRDPRHRANGGGRTVQVTINLPPGSAPPTRQTVQQLTAGFARALATADARLN